MQNQIRITLRKLSSLFVPIAFIYFSSINAYADTQHDSQNITPDSRQFDTQVPQKNLDSLDVNNSNEKQEKNTSEDREDSDSNTDLRWWWEYGGLAFTILIFSTLLQIVINYCYRIKEDRKKYLSILKILYDEFDRNFGFECQIHALLYVEIQPTFPLSQFAKKNILYDLIQLSKNNDLVRDVIHKYFEFDHIQNRLDEHNKGVDQSFVNGTIVLIGGNIRGVLTTRNKIAVEIIKLDKKDKNIKILADDELDIMYNKFQDDNDVKNVAAKLGKDLSVRPKFK